MKTIEQKSAWSEEDEATYYGVIETEQYLLDVVNGIKKFDVGNISIKEECVRELNWLKSLKDRVQPQLKQKWSEKDESMWLSVLQDLQNIKDESPRVNFEPEFNWLKSLKPQNWTKEDEERYASCLQRLGTGNPEQPETINSKWFKEHAYPQKTWKPSDEQMRPLEYAIDYFKKKKNDTTYLESLYQDLKKLREE